MNWNQPICDHCWTAREPNRVPVRVVYRQQHSCAFCGRTTQSGIYVRADPHSVPFPRRDTEREQR